MCQVFIPMKDAGWKEMMLEVDRKSRLTNNNNSMASYCFRQLHFVDDVGQGHELFEGIPKYMYVLQVGNSLKQKSCRLKILAPDFITSFILF